MFGLHNNFKDNKEKEERQDQWLITRKNNNMSLKNQVETVLCQRWKV